MSPRVALLLALCLVAVRGEACPAGLQVTVSAYARGHLTASGRRPQLGMLALSRDVERALGVRFGDRVVLTGLGTFVFHDRMPRRWSRRADLVLPSRHAARQFGLQRAHIRRAASHPGAIGLPGKGPHAR
jgi:3D (Asp-Asp-Asp) domain-containing protein